MTRTLSLAGAVQTLDERFRAGFRFRTGGANPDPISPLAVGIPLDQGFNPWSLQPVGDPKREASRSYPHPAFTDMGAWSTDIAPNADLSARLGVNPIKVHNGTISMKPLLMTPAQKKLVPSSIRGAAGKEWLSPAMNTYPYCQRYGIFEWVLKLPKSKGEWASGWMMPADLSRYPEIDVFEQLDPNSEKSFYTTIHLSATQQISFRYVSPVSLFDRYTTVSMDWGPQITLFYVNRVLVWEIPTPASCHKPMYLITNVAVGKPGIGPGPIDPVSRKTGLGEMLVTNWRAWQRPEYAT